MLNSGEECLILVATLMQKTIQMNLTKKQNETATPYNLKETLQSHQITKMSCPRSVIQKWQRWLSHSEITIKKVLESPGWGPLGAEALRGSWLFDLFRLGTLMVAWSFRFVQCFVPCSPGCKSSFLEESCWPMADGYSECIRIFFQILNKIKKRK